MGSIFDKYQPKPVKDIKKLFEQDDAASNFNKRAGRLELADGQNKVRIWPAHPGEKNYIKMFAAHWLPLENKQGEIGRRSIPNGRIHGGLKVDAVEAYIKLCQEKFGTSEDTDDIEKLKEVMDFKKGLLMSTTFGMYASLIDKTGKKGPAEIWDVYRTVRDDIMNAKQVEQEDEEIAVDPFTHWKTGNYLLVTRSKEKGKNKTKVGISEKTCPITEEEMIAFDKMTPLSKLPQANFTQRDFENELEGLKNFDEEHDLGIIDSDEFKEVVKSIKKELAARGGKGSAGKVHEVEEDTITTTEENDELPFDADEKPKKAGKSTPPAKKATVVEEEDDDEPTVEEEVETTDQFDSMDRSELKQFIADNELEVSVKKSHTDNDIRANIRAVMPAQEEVPVADEDEDEEEAPIPIKKSAPVKEAPKSNKPTLADIKAKLNASGKKK